MVQQAQELGVMDLPPIGMGCWSYGGGEYWGKQNQHDVNDMVHLALDLGVNFFDTAEAYNDGKSETSLAAALKGKRDRAIVCSKVSPCHTQPRQLREHCEGSLKRLGMDYLDLYMIHWPINGLSIRHFTQDRRLIQNPPSVHQAFDTLMSLKKEGKIRAVGVSNFGPKQLREALDTGAEVSVNETAYNILSRAIEAEIIPFCLKNNIAIIGSMTLMQGVLAGTYLKAEDIPPHQAHSRHFAHHRGGEHSRHEEDGCEAEVFKALEQLRALAEDQRCSMAALAIAWVLSKPGIHCALLGSRNKQELLNNISAVQINPDASIIAAIDDLSLPVLRLLGNNPDYYENGSRPRSW